MVGTIFTLEGVAGAATATRGTKDTAPVARFIGGAVFVLAGDRIKCATHFLRLVAKEGCAEIGFVIARGINAVCRTNDGITHDVAFEMDFQVFDNRTVRVVFYQRVFQPGVVNIAFHFLVGEIDVCLHEVTQPHLCCSATDLLAGKGVGEVYFVIRIAVFGEAEEVVIDAVHQGMAFIFDVAFVR